MTSWLAAILGAALIGAAVYRLDGRSTDGMEDTDGLTREQRQRVASLRSALALLEGRDGDLGDVLDAAEYIRVGTRGLPASSGGFRLHTSPNVSTSPNVTYSTS